MPRRSSSSPQLRHAQISVAFVKMLPEKRAKKAASLWNFATSPRKWRGNCTTRSSSICVKTWCYRTKVRSPILRRRLSVPLWSWMRPTLDWWADHGCFGLTFVGNISFVTPLVVRHSVGPSTRRSHKCTSMRATWKLKTLSSTVTLCMRRWSATARFSRVSLRQHQPRRVDRPRNEWRVGLTLKPRPDGCRTAEPMHHGTMLKRPWHAPQRDSSSP